MILSTGYKKAIKLLIEKGANVKAVDSKNMTPLHFIALLESSNVGHRNWPEEDTLGKLRFHLVGDDWCSRLIEINISHKIEFAELLINHGADVNAKAHYWTEDDETPFDLATSQKCKFLEQNFGSMTLVKLLFVF